MAKKRKATTEKTFWCERTVLVSPWVGICLTEAAYKRAVKRSNPEWTAPWVSRETTEATMHCFQRLTGGKWDGHYMCLICVNHAYLQRMGVERDHVLHLLMHEAVHVWQQLCVIIGEDCPGDEIEAYVIEAITRNLWAGYDDAVAAHEGD